MILLLPLILLFHLILLFLSRFTLWPEMVVYPYLINHSFLLYKDIINPYPPTLSYVLAFFAKLFGYDPLPYKILTWLFILLLDILIFVFSKHLSKSTKLASVSTLFFVLLSIPFGANGLWFDLVQTPFILSGFYFLYSYLKAPKTQKPLILSGLFLSVSFFIKQQTIWIIVWFILILIFKHKNKLSLLKKIPLFLSPFVIILLLQLIFVVKQGLLQNFIYWAWYFPFFLSSKMPGYILLPSKRQLLILVVLFAFFCPTIIKRKAQTNIVLSVSAVLLLFAYPRFDLFHLIPSLAVLSLLVGQNLINLSKINIAPKVVFVLSGIFLLAFTSRYLLKNTTGEVRFFEPEMVNAARTLQKITGKNEPVFIQNGPDQLFVIADRLPTKPWAIQFPWYLEKNDLQEKIIRGLVDQKPKYIVYKPYEKEAKYQIGSYSPVDLASYLNSNYQNYQQISPGLWLKSKIEK